MLQVFEYKRITKNSSSSKSSPVILSGAAIEHNFLNNGAISFIDVPESKKIFLPFPDSDNVVSQPLNAWKNRNAQDLSDPNLSTIWSIGIWISTILLHQIQCKVHLRIPVDEN